MTLQADLKALETDAGTWDTISSTLSAAASSADGISLGTPELSWAAEVTGLTTTYAEFQTQVADRLREGEKNTSTLADGLRAVKSAYESTDAHARDEMDGLWDAVSE
ncbi:MULTISPECIES: hypothetical protein [unclassified Nocardioides]|uniref:hypothetical protein n=1 Tax=unclassified Nocardioides TaxID=2615069 RepID=UPI0009F0E2CB|nr:MULTISPECIES: hypothetical protein [unclassified Nocardioides]GAW51684.1 uncharacterized protein PD653B2_4029 [Nocardioides sp. PD653-B2]GAW55348.1 uncharacterized protein PD653_2773 [Nocardioides sp. PD653]